MIQANHILPMTGKQVENQFKTMIIGNSIIFKKTSFENIKQLKLYIVMSV